MLSPSFAAVLRLLLRKRFNVEQAQHASNTRPAFEEWVKGLRLPGSAPAPASADDFQVCRVSEPHAHTGASLLYMSWILCHQESTTRREPELKRRNSSSRKVKAA